MPEPKREPKPEREPSESAPEGEDLPEFDFVDPLKRDEENELPGIDPIVIVPPE